MNFKDKFLIYPVHLSLCSDGSKPKFDFDRMDKHANAKVPCAQTSLHRVK